MLKILLLAWVEYALQLQDLLEVTTSDVRWRVLLNWGGLWGRSEYHGISVGHGPNIAHDPPMISSHVWVQYSIYWENTSQQSAQLKWEPQ